MNKRLINKLSSVIQNSSPKCILSSRTIVKKINQLKFIKSCSNLTFLNFLLEKITPHTLELLAWEFEKFSWIITDEISSSIAKEFKPVLLNEDDIAFLQYTSGSTSLPKGVVVTHKNLLSNISLISKSIGINKDDKAVSWLPPYHDMGLIGSLLTSFVNQIPLYMLSPIDFIKNPYNWLKAITLFKGTMSAAPNFAYSLCNRKITDEQISKLDLSSWRAALNGAEPINIAVLNEFEKRFTLCGFNKAVFFPCYGLAESTLFVTGRYGIETQNIKLHDGKFKATEIVSSGYLNQDVVVKIMDYNSKKEMPNGEIGEICITGDSVTKGYWNSDLVHDIWATIIDRGKASKFLKTGDLGFILNNQLFITGRIKDLIIIRGVNYYPQDIENSITSTFKKIKYGACVAFSFESAREESLGIMFEVTQIEGQETIQMLFEKIKQLVMNEYQLNVKAIYNIQPKAIMKTTSGKIERVANKKALLDNKLPVIYDARY